MDNAQKETPPPPVWLIATTCLAVIFIVTGGVATYFAQRDVFNQSAIHSLETVSVLKIDQIANWKAERVGDANTVTDSIGATRVARCSQTPKLLTAR